MGAEADATIEQLKNLARVAWCTAACAVLVLPAAGCATYTVRVTTYLSADLPFPSPADAARVRVVAECDPDEPLLEAEVRRKIESLLAERGFEVAAHETPDVGAVDGDAAAGEEEGAGAMTPGAADAHAPAPAGDGLAPGGANADYILFAFLGIDEGVTRTGVTPVYTPGGLVTTHIRTSRGRRIHAYSRYPGRTDYIPYAYTDFTRFLTVTLYEHGRWQSAGGDDDANARAVVWRSTAASSGASTDLRYLIDYLLAATFEHFGEDTRRQVRERYTAEDDQVEALRGAND